MNKNKFIGYRPTWAEVNLKNLAYNFNQIKRKVPGQVKVMACVKADAYGHGLIPVAKKLAASGVDYLSVASIDEAIKLRQARIMSPILVLGVVLKEDIAPLFRYDISQTICSQELAIYLNNMGRREGRVIKVHIKIDTGMGRIGILYQDALRFIEKVCRMKYINIEGIFTHFPCADTNRNFTIYQVEIFKRLISRLERKGICVPLCHAANSLGIVNYENSHFNMVRPGIMLYGLYPAPGLKISLKPVMSLKTKVVYVKRVPKGWGISYGHTYVTPRDTYIATLPIGYGDGYPRNLSNTGYVIIKGKLLKISGVVCMDQIMVDVGDLKVKVGDEVVLIGSQGENKITVENLSRLCGTIPYEIVCGLGSRIPRIYL